MTTIEIHSIMSVPMEFFHDDTTLSSATGFFYRRNGHTFLVSNWHVFSGRDANTGQPLAEKTGAIPNKFRIGYFSRDKKIVLSNFIRLIHDPQANWLQHPRGQHVDVACFPIALPHDFAAKCVNDENTSPRLYKRVGAVCFVVGFPLRFQEGDVLPVWKRATVASEYDVDFRGRPSFLIDTTTSEGMSGSPVYFRQVGALSLHDGSTGIATGPVTEFAGIYSGRVNSSRDGTLDLGYVWRRETIDQVIDGKLPGTYELEKQA